MNQIGFELFHDRVDPTRKPVITGGRTFPDHASVDVSVIFVIFGSSLPLGLET